MRIAVLIALFFGAIQPNYAHVLEGVELEKSFEKWAVGTNFVKAWEGLVAIPNLRKNIDWLKQSSKWIDDGADFVTTTWSYKTKERWARYPRD